MNTPLSLVQELRGIRGGQKHNHNDLESLLSEIQEARREWQEQVDQAQRLLRELMGAVAELSGVSLPGVSLDAQKDGDGSLRIGFKTLKDRIKNELEGFASTSAAEISKNVHGKSQTVLDPLEKEMNTRLDNLANEFREKLQARLESEQNEVANQAKLRVEETLQGKMNEFAEWIKLMTEGTMSSVPAEVQKSLQPHVEEVKERLKTSFQQHLNMVLMELERTAQHKVEGIQNEMKAVMAGLSEQARQTCSQSAEQAMKDLNNRLGTAAQDCTRQFEAGSKAYTEENLGQFKAQLSAFSAASKEEFRSYADSHVDGFKERLRSTSQELQQKSAQEIASNVQKASQDALNASIAQVQQRLGEALEHSKNELRNTMGSMLEDGRKQMGEFALSARDSLSGDAARLSDQLRNLGEQMKSAETDQIVALRESLSNLSRQTLEGHAQSVKQVADLQIEEIRRALTGLQTRMASEYEGQLRQFMENQRKAVAEEIQKHVGEASAGAVERIKASSSQVVQDISGKVNKEVNTATTLLNQWAHQTTTWAESSIKESMESYKRQVAEFTNTLLEEQRVTIQQRVGGIQERLEEAARLLRVPEANSSTTTSPNREQAPHQV
jgi:hypothetical protein